MQLLVVFREGGEDAGAQEGDAAWSGAGEGGEGTARFPGPDDGVRDGSGGAIADRVAGGGLGANPEDVVLMELVPGRGGGPGRCGEEAEEAVGEEGSLGAECLHHPRPPASAAASLASVGGATVALHHHHKKGREKET